MNTDRPLPAGAGHAHHAHPFRGILGIAVLILIALGVFGIGRPHGLLTLPARLDPAPYAASIRHVRTAIAALQSASRPVPRIDPAALRPAPPPSVEPPAPATTSTTQPPGSPPSPPRLDATLFGQGVPPVAILDGKLARVGEQVAGWTVLEVTADSVRLLHPASGHEQTILFQAHETTATLP